MDIEKGKVVEFNFASVDEHGAPIAGVPTQTTAILFGQGNVIRGIENALVGHGTGDRFTVTVPPQDGYGERKEDWTERVSKKHFAPQKRFTAGSVVHLRTEKGNRPVTILKVGSKFIDVDLNHPHAGQVLHFDIEILLVRPATAEEVAHGHSHSSHGSHGHHA